MGAVICDAPPLGITNRAASHVEGGRRGILREAQPHGDGCSRLRLRNGRGASLSSARPQRERGDSSARMLDVLERRSLQRHQHMSVIWLDCSTIPSAGRYHLIVTK